MKSIVATVTVLFVYLTNGFGQNSSLTENPLCTLIVKTDNNEIVDVWINKQLVGKTPLRIDTMKAGFYNISFLNPYVRDSILNSPIKSVNDYSYVPIVSNFQNELTSGGNSSIKMASGELARESNKKINLPANQSTIVIFKIGQAKESMNSEKTKGNVKVLLGILAGAALAGIFLFVFLHNSNNTEGP